MNQGIIDYLDGYWNAERCCYSLNCEGKGYLEYPPRENTLYIWSGEGYSDSYGYEVEIQDLQHLISLEALL